MATRKYRTKQYAKAMGVSYGTVLNWIHKDQMPDGATVYPMRSNVFVIYVDDEVHMPFADSVDTADVHSIP